ncbi:MAG: MBL fold metallo-hydrolase [Chitinivibrionales bacterium]
MNTEIITVKTGHTNNYIIRQQGTIVIDAGVPGSMSRFKKAFEQFEIDYNSIELIVLTHGHWDHIGCAHRLRELTKVPVVASEPDSQWIEKGLKSIPLPSSLWGKALLPFLLISKPFIHVEPAIVDITVKDRVFPLNSYGIDGSIIRTPGHTAGSLSVLLRTGDACVGDLLANGLPVRFGAGIMSMGDDAEQMQGNLHFLLKLGASRFFPGHGKPFEMEKMGRHELAEHRAHHSIFMPGHARTCSHEE